ncbi:MAG: methyltransferase domain-containing protein [Vicinamibacterales bacterium]
MRIDERTVARQYETGGLLGSLRAALTAQGLAPDTISVDDLAPADEFHMGGRQATKEFHAQLGWQSGQRLLDVGCGIGGAARYVASRYGVDVTGLDLTAEFVETGNEVSRWVGLSDRVALRQGSALAPPFGDQAFDGAYMMHVGMNIADKPALFAGLARVLRPGGTFGVYDVMRAGDGAVPYPVPWAESGATCALASPADYEDALAAAGFEIAARRDRREFALEFFHRMRAAMAGADGPPPIGLHLILGANAALKVRHMIEALTEGVIAPVEMIAVRRA